MTEPFGDDHAYPGDLVARWRAAARGAGATAADPALVAAGEGLLRRWREPHRHYHTVDHLTAVLSVVDAESAWLDHPGPERLDHPGPEQHDHPGPERLDHPGPEQHDHPGPASDLVRLAAWCHDAIYEPRSAGDANERDSAALAGELLTGLGLPGAAVAEVERLVLLTAGHRTEPGDRAGSLLCDADLAILAAPPAEYDRYATAIRREYAHVPEDLFRAGRAAVLRELLALPTRYRLPDLAARWERPARANLTRELARLAPGDGPDIDSPGSP
ncbi:metal-dependent phosphohydrolase [Micromonospora sp. NPDC050397]|uniref:HD domain-containing protein n=1 Tax=Micromonospora sp. NPDC050397 TaxID=3364279 RepID=UPI003850FE4F